MKISIAVVTLVGLSGLALAGGDEGTKKSDEAKPKAPNELADRVKAMSGTWTCEGTGAGMDGKSMAFKGTLKAKAELDGHWVHDSFTGTMGDGKTAMKFGFESYATFDANLKKWRTLFMDNFGGQMVGLSDPMKDGKIDTTSDGIDMRGKSTFKDHTDMSDAKKGMHMWGEETRDNGKTWNKIYDMTCKK
jgi:hypothetical protein